MGNRKFPLGETEVWTLVGSSIKSWHVLIKGEIWLRCGFLFFFYLLINKVSFVSSYVRYIFFFDGGRRNVVRVAR